MMYEIPKEMFKQRLEKKLNFAFIDLNDNREKDNTVLDGTEFMSFSDSFASDFVQKYPNKGQNIVLYSLKQGDRRPSQAAEQLHNQGYQFVYFYCGEESDSILDKGIN